MGFSKFEKDGGKLSYVSTVAVDGRILPRTILPRLRKKHSPQVLDLDVLDVSSSEFYILINYIMRGQQYWQSVMSA